MFCSTRSSICDYARINARDAHHVSAIDDGEYACVVVDVARDDDGVVVVELAIATGAAKGSTIRLRSAMTDEPLAWLGMPGTLRVTDGAPNFRLDS